MGGLEANPHRPEPSSLVEAVQAEEVRDTRLVGQRSDVEHDALIGGRHHRVPLRALLDLPDDRRADAATVVSERDTAD